METADDATTGVAPFRGLVVGAEDGMAGTTGGTEERGLGLDKQVEIAERGKLAGRVCAEALAETHRVTGIAWRDTVWLRFLHAARTGYFTLPSPACSPIIFFARP